MLHSFKIRFVVKKKVDYKQLVIKVNTDAWVRKLICGGKTLSTIKAKGTNIKVKSSGVFLQILQLYIIPQVPKSFSPRHSTCNLRRRKKSVLFMCHISSS